MGVTLSAGVPALKDGSHVNEASFFMGFLYIIAIGGQLTSLLLCTIREPPSCSQRQSLPKQKQVQ